MDPAATSISGIAGTTPWAPGWSGSRCDLPERW